MIVFPVNCMNETYQKLQELNPNAIMIDGFDDALIGYCEQFRAIYDWDLIILELTNQGMERDEAIEYFYFNIAGTLKNQNYYPIVLHKES